MGNKDRMDKFNKVSSVKAIGEASFSAKLKNAQHASDLSDYDAGNDNISRNGDKGIQNVIKTKLFANQENSKNTKRESKEISKEITSDSANVASSEWQSGKEKREKERYVKTYENKFTQNMNKKRFNSLDQSISQQPILNKTLGRKSAFRAYPKYMNSNKNKMGNAHINAKNYSPVASESVNQNYKKRAENPVKEKHDVSIDKLNSGETLEKQSEDLNSEVAARHSLESDATNCQLKKMGAKTSQSTSTFKKVEGATSLFVITTKEQNRSKTKESELKQEKSEVLQPDTLTSNEKIFENCSKTLCNQIEETAECLKEEIKKDTKTNLTNEETVECLNEEVNKDAKTSLTNEEKMSDKVMDVEYLNTSCELQLKDEDTRKELEQQQLHYCRYNNDYYFICRPITVYPLHQCIPDSTFGQYGWYSDSSMPRQYFYDGELSNESLSSEFPNVMEYYQEQDKVSTDNKQCLENENDRFNSNGFIYHPTSVTPFVLSWFENGMVYYQHYPNFSPIQCSCFVAITQ